MGAGIATELAGLFPERVQKAVMIDGFLATGGAGPGERLDGNREAVQRMLADSDRKPPVYSSVEDMIDRVAAATDQSRGAAAELVTRGHRLVPGGATWRTDPRIRFPTPLRMPEEQIDELLRRTTAPALLIVANSGDRWYLQGLEARRMAHPDLHVAYMDGPHHIHLEPAHYRQVASLTRSFLGLEVPEAALE
jgi:pimeloyl-ACP methyl ester carboxylesterase